MTVTEEGEAIAKSKKTAATHILDLTVGAFKKLLKQELQSFYVGSIKKITVLD